MSFCPMAFQNKFNIFACNILVFHPVLPIFRSIRKYMNPDFDYVVNISDVKWSGLIKIIVKHIIHRRL